MHWYFLISSYYLTVSNGCSLTALKSEEFTLSSDSFKWGGGVREGGREMASICLRYSTCFLYALVFPYIFLLFDCFLISSYYLTVSNGCSLTALKSKEFTLSSGSFKWGEGGFVSFTRVNLKI